jgi:hypothetical protein
MRETSTTPLIAWSRAFPATPVQAREARQFLAALLGGRTAADDAVLCLSELVTNASVHSRSREPGGQFTVRAQLDDIRLRVEVTDVGGSWAWAAYPDNQHGRGLLIVAQLACAWGRTDDAAAGWCTWFEIDCPLLPSPSGGRQPPALTRPAGKAQS